ncbi:hypothetical protein PHYBLDRAFT_150307 [Phycomyces blakesleeanus NRRL 1555(-)]|uniref:Uncharacterized protein n=1 Tax=Phycomyces blakesleeanus (strain ATCC 8743b / DSM 1359 / FGSC 10004 / NBRC 33097 / NRRL 1555) TaxID=763407 RepID=A0A162NE40_PHYB8|nr:hypothetical protein PHYBLDRAFT_150307 [Phycomyces blakesleeanus NRRL 1555(-)]OAD68714.1 hypothetical protein PHYBLDRAFT_150307 [Phycomyces blakesleeanus NRRL 1555(-)]|eukprot:XP_018286754.1 hypothetical protein PHYBLDRAFT_150307 [Phycomyces blakesleeanus NRRL 1555(-)]
MSAGWPITSEGECAGADSDIEFWGPLGYKTIDDSFEDISCLLILIQDFYKSKGVQVDLFTNVCHQYTFMVNNFLGKVILFFEHENSIMVNGQLKPKVVHMVEVNELVSLVVSDATGNTQSVSASATVLLHDLPNVKHSLLNQYLTISEVKYSPSATLPQTIKVFHKEDAQAMILHVEDTINNQCNKLAF